MLKNIMAVAGAFLLSTSAVQAADYKVDFSMAGFGPVAPGMTPAPFDSAFGSAIFSASSPGATWDALKQFSLTIGDVSYTLSDAELITYFFGNGISGILNSTDMQFGTNDFYLTFLPGDPGASLTYSSTAGPGYWYASTPSVTYTELGVSAMPEAQTYAMLLAGLALTGAMARRRRPR